MSYIEKLKGFNSTEKYREEMRLMIEMLDLKQGEKVLDYGCGLGTMVAKINEETMSVCYGYDVNDLYTGDMFYYRKELYFQVDKVFFMHSFAHIENVHEIILKLKNDFMKQGGTICMITPNLEYLNLQDKANYTPDPTVFRHYSISDLVSLFNGLGITKIDSFPFGKSENGKQERIFFRATL